VVQIDRAGTLLPLRIAERQAQTKPWRPTGDMPIPPEPPWRPTGDMPIPPMPPAKPPRPHRPAVEPTQVATAHFLDSEAWEAFVAGTTGRRPSLLRNA
jgi:hypothetical protein